MRERVRARQLRAQNSQIQIKRSRHDSGEARHKRQGNGIWRIFCLSGGLTFPPVPSLGFRFSKGLEPGRERDLSPGRPGVDSKFFSALVRKNPLCLQPTREISLRQRLGWRGLPEEVEPRVPLTGKGGWTSQGPGEQFQRKGKDERIASESQPPKNEFGTETTRVPSLNTLKGLWLSLYRRNTQQM
ncbi:hypothetical protein CapIbe_005256 [Capra ibex]